MSELTYEEYKKMFLKAVENHSMTVLLDEDTHRHLVFSNNGSLHFRFELITVPGYLTIAGDIGCFTFNRVIDMFRFFRQDELGINPRYWGEKLQGEVQWREYSQDKFDASVREYWEHQYEECLSDWESDNELSEQEKARLSEQRELSAIVWEQIQDEILRFSDQEQVAYNKLSDFVCDEDPDFGVFEDFFENSTTRCTSRYIHCLLAIVWGIQQYDEFKAKQIKKEAVEA